MRYQSREIIVFGEALDQWGPAQQELQLVEEFGEVLTAISHYRRGRIGREELVEELADAWLLIGQELTLLEREGTAGGLSAWWLFDKIANEKTSRTEARIAQARRKAQEAA